MRFAFSPALWLLLLLPLLAGAYLLLLQRPTPVALVYPSLTLMREAERNCAWLRRHLAAVLLLSAISALTVAIARPTANVKLPIAERTVIIAIDTSPSMAVTDVQPNRLAVAQAAARALIRAQPRGVRIGVIRFGGRVDVLQFPTFNHADAEAALAQLGWLRGSAVGTAIVGALITLFPDAAIGEDYEIFDVSTLYAFERVAVSKVQHGDARLVAASDRSAAVVLFADGEQNTGIPAARAARWAAERGVRVFTVGVGTPAGGIGYVSDWRVQAGFDAERLREVALITGGTYFELGEHKPLQNVARQLSARISWQKVDLEIAAFLTALAATLAVASAVVSLMWAPRLT